MSYESLIREGCGKLNIELDDVKLNKLLVYISEIELFNPTYKLVGAKGDEIVIKHILDSLAAVPVMKEYLRDGDVIADVGSGAGLPGIPLSIVLDDHRFVLIERMGRRVSFLNNAIARCNLSDRVVVLPRDLSDVKDRFDAVTFRAFHPLYDILDGIDCILNENGRVFAYKGLSSSLDEELETVEKKCRSTWNSERKDLEVPFLDASRILCVMTRG